MKKLIIAVALVSAAVVANAATVDWSTNGIQLDGDFDEGTGTYASGYAAYLFNDATLAQTTMAAAIAADQGWSDNLSKSLGFAVTDGDGAFSPEAATGLPNEAFTGYLVLFNAETAADATKAWVSGTWTAPDNSLHSIKLDYDGDAFIDATSATWSTVNAVPEPTSGLLLLLGVAGLALRRRRA